MMSRIILYAPNVGSGGGLVLLRAMMKSWPAALPVTAILDERAKVILSECSKNNPVYWTKARFVDRWNAERLLSRLAKAEDLVFCFHNLPPVLPSLGRVICYVHNPHLVGLVPSRNLSGWIRIRITIERLIGRLFGGRVDRYIVQTPTMLEALKKRLGEGAPPIDVLPFIDTDMMPGLPSSLSSTHPYQKRINETGDKDWDFIYVSDGPAHKNHAVLFEAWRLLADKGLFPSLRLTLNPLRDVAVRRRLHDLVTSTGAKIEDLGTLPHDEVLKAYGRARALIFPSYAESFGIPLMEAEAAGLPILAAELDFVRDVCEPTLTFNPHSARSIARAVERFLHGTRFALDPLTAGQFVSALSAQAVLLRQATTDRHAKKTELG